MIDLGTLKIQNKMKKIILCLTLCLTFLSCNNDDEPNAPIDLSEKLIGEWGLNRREIEGSLEDLEFCELFTTIEFLENGDFNVELFIGDEPENCQSASNTGIWEYLVDDRFTIQLSGQSDATMFRVSFSDNYNIMLLKELEDDEIIYFEEYIRQ